MLDPSADRRAFAAAADGDPTAQGFHRLGRDATASNVWSEREHDPPKVLDDVAPSLLGSQADRPQDVLGRPKNCRRRVLRRASDPPKRRLGRPELSQNGLDDGGKGRRELGRRRREKRQAEEDAGSRVQDLEPR